MYYMFTNSLSFPLAFSSLLLLYHILTFKKLKIKYFREYYFDVKSSVISPTYLNHENAYIQ